MRISEQTRSQSAEPWKPVSGAKPPLPIISKSAVWRSERVRESSVIVSLMRYLTNRLGEGVFEVACAAAPLVDPHSVFARPPSGRRAASRPAHRLVQWVQPIDG